MSSLPLLSNDTIEEDKEVLTQLANASAALRAGKMPTSAQLEKMTQQLLKSPLLQSDAAATRVSQAAEQTGASRFLQGRGPANNARLSKKGREVVVAARQVLESLLRIGLEKNSDDKIQRFIFACSKASVDVDASIKKPDVPLPSSQELKEANEALQSLFSSLISSPHLRGILGDLINLVRDLFADAAENVANGAIGIVKTSKKAAKSARPNEEERQDGLKAVEQVQGYDVDPKDVKKQAIRAAEDARDDAQKQLKRKAKQARQYIDQSLPTDTKDAAIEKFKQIVSDIQQNPEYSDAIDTLFSIARKYAKLAASKVKEAAEKSTADADANEAAEDAASLFKQIVETFTGPLDDVLRTADKVIKDLKDDDQIRQLVDDAEQFLDRAIHDEGYAVSSKAQRRAEELYDQAQDLVKKNADWKKDIDALTTELNKAAENAANDKALSELGYRLEKFNDATRRFAKTGLSLADGGGIWTDLTQVMIPRILQVIKSIPLPRVEFTSADVDLIIDNVKFTSPSFLPDAARFSSHLDVSCQRGYAAYASSFKSSTTMSISGLRMQAKDISYYINKKSGWIGLEDAGLMDIYIGSTKKGADDGLDVTLTVENATEDDRESFFKLKKVDVPVEHFDVYIHNSRHPIRNFFARPAVRTYMEKQFVQVLEEQIAVSFREFDKQAFAYQQRAIGASGAASDPLAFFRGIFAPSFFGIGGGGSGLEWNDQGKGFTKVGSQGEYVLAIGVDEQLLPGKLTGLGRQGKDVVARKQAVERLVEEGRSTYEDVRDQVEQVAAEAQDEGERALDQHQDALRREQRDDDWRSDAFDF